jgi:hypothetical protein
MGIQTKIRREESVAISGTGKKTLNIYTRKNLHYILLYFTKTSAAVSVANMKAGLTDIVPRFDGKAFHEIDATFLLDIERYYKDGIVSGDNANIAGWIKIPFVRNDLPIAANRMATSVGIDGVKSIVVDLQVGDVTNIDNVEVFSVTDEGAPRPMGVTRRFSKHNHSFATTGEDQIPDLPFITQEVFGWLAAHVKYATGTLDKFTLKVDDREEFRDVSPNALKTLLQENQRAPQSGYLHIDFAKDRDPLSYLEMPAKEALLKINWSAAAPNDYNVYLERLFREPKKV